MLEVYDLAREEKPATAFVVQNAIQALQAVTAYVQANSPFNKGLDDVESEDAVEVTFPISSNVSTTFELNNELNWFFKVFNRVSEELSEDKKKPTIRSIDIVDVSIAIAVDWRFLLVVMLIWMRIQKSGRDTHIVRSAIESLISQGLDDKQADDIEKKLTRNAAQMIDEVRSQYGEISGEGTVSTLWLEEIVLEIFLQNGQIPT